MEALVRKQEELSQLPWKLKKRSILELAKAYDADGQYQNAINSFRYLIKSTDKFSSTVTNAAQLYLAKLQYRLLKPQQRTNDNPDMVAVLHALKDLQIQKKLVEEPLHLEAALQYAEIRSALSDQENYAKNAHFFFKRMFEDFQSTGDPIGEEYNHLRSQYPEKDLIFSAYMQYLDAKLLHYQAQIAKMEKKYDQVPQLRKEALQLLDGLTHLEEALQPFLLERIKRAKVEIAQEL